MVEELLTLRGEVRRSVGISCEPEVRAWKAAEEGREQKKLQPCKVKEGSQLYNLKVHSNKTWFRA